MSAPSVLNMSRTALTNDYSSLLWRIELLEKEVNKLKSHKSSNSGKKFSIEKKAVKQAEKKQKAVAIALKKAATAEKKQLIAEKKAVKQAAKKQKAEAKKSVSDVQAFFI